MRAGWRRGARQQARRLDCAVVGTEHQLTLFALVLLAVAAGMVASVVVWGQLGAAAGAGALVATLGVVTLGAACR